MGGSTENILDILNARGRLDPVAYGNALRELRPGELGLRFALALAGELCTDLCPENRNMLWRRNATEAWGWIMQDTRRMEALTWTTS